MYNLSQMEIKQLRKLIENGRFKLTLHAQRRLDQRQITIAELKAAIINGVIVETYSDDKPYPSCLVMGRVKGGFPLYVVCALSDVVNIVTAHWMDPAKWLDPITRREKKKGE